MPLTRRGSESTTRPRSPLSASMKYFLMTGTYPDARLRGKWELLMIPIVNLPSTLAVAWADHADELIDEARRSGFEPWGVRHRRPRGPAVQQWETSFNDAHKN